MIIKKSRSNIKNIVRLCNENERMSVLIVGFKADYKDYIYNLLEAIHEDIISCIESKNKFRVLFKNGSIIDSCIQCENVKGRKYNIILADTDINDELFNYVLMPQIVHYRFRYAVN